MLSDHDIDEDSQSESGSDFDEDEDPDKIEVPGGGRDLLTAVTYAKKKGNNTKSNILSATTNINFNNNNNNNNNYYNQNNNNNNNISNNNSLLLSNQKTIAGSGIFQINNKTNLLKSNINMPKRLPTTAATATTTTTAQSSSTSSSTASAMEAGVLSTSSTSSILSSTSSSLLAAGSSSGIGQFTSSQIMSMAAIAAAGARPLIPVNTATTRVPSTNNNNNNNNNINLNLMNNNKINNYNAGGLAGAKTADGGIFNTNSNLNMAASLLAQMGMNFGFDASPSTAPVSTPKMNAIILNKIQALIAANPSFLTSGIPNSLIKQIYAATLNPNKPAINQMQMNSATAHPTEEEDDFEELGVAETYAEYWPAKLKLGKKHPDSVVETASLSSVEPCEIYYKVSIPIEIINSGQLSALQLESITYASQAHCHMLPDGSRAGFLIGDGAGVGKGRTIAGIIYENYLKGRKRSLWISVSNDLKYDAERDLMDIGASKIPVHALNKFKYDKINSDVNNNTKRGVVFSTYSALIGESNNKTCKYRTRFKQLIQWCGEDFDGLIIFDECHKAKNLCPVGSGKPTKTGITVLELQNKLPKARVVYASATGASEPKNMAYMVRLGLWGPGTAFPTFNDFINAVEKRGVGAMEVVAMDMKQRGIYIARQLSFHGVTFRIEEVALSKDFRRMYDKSVELWVEAMQKFTEAAELIDAESRMKKTMWGQFWSSHQRFFKYLCIAAKVKYVVKVATDSLKQGKCVVIGLQSTGEARTLEQLERDDGELTDFVSTAKGVFQSLVEKHFPAPDRSRINRILGFASRSSYVNELMNSKKAPNAKNNNNKRKITNASKGATAEKRKRSNSWNNSNDSDSSDTDEDSDNDSDEKDSDAKRDSATDSDNDEENDSEPGDMTDSNESDFNPFFCDSDSDNEPWLARTKKQTKKKIKKKIPEKKSKKSKERSESISSNCTSLTATTTSATATSGLGSSASSTISSFRAYEPTKKKGPISTQDKIQDLLTKKQELKDTITPIGVNGVKHNYGPPSEAAIERACSMKEELLRKIEELGEFLPPNTLDQLIDELGGTDNVAEMTGRKGRVVQSSTGAIQYESRSEADAPLETLNITEKQRFMNGEKNVAIISEAASSGISLQSDRRVRNQRRRVHITLELPWSADRAIQQFGRTHRSNQVNAPEYIFLISDLAGERRFASTVAKRLESLGALTHGDRRATESRDLSQFNIDNKYGRNALETVMKTIMGYEAPLVQPPRDYKGDFFKDIAGALVGVGIIVNSETNPGVLSLDKDYNNISKFLNRILGMPVELQNRLFKYFTDTLMAIITQAKRTGRFDMGILDLGTAGENVTRVKLVRFIRKHATGKAPTEMHTVRVERGMIWQEAINKYNDVVADYEGFYLSHQLRNNKRTAILAVEVEPPKANLTMKTKKKEILFQVYRPNTGLQVRHETLSELEKKYKKVSSDEAEPHWSQQYDASVYTCSHAYWNGNCRNVNMGQECEVGLRQRSYYVLAGSVLSVWSRLEQVLAMRNASSKMQVIRLRTTEGDKIVGTLIPKSCYDLLMEELKTGAERVEEINA